MICNSKTKQVWPLVQNAFSTVLVVEDTATWKQKDEGGECQDYTGKLQIWEAVRYTYFNK